MLKNRHNSEILLAPLRNQEAVISSNSGIPVATAARFTRAMLDNKIIITLEEASGRRAALYSFEPLMNLVRV